MTTNTLDVLRANLHAALRKESEALANARRAVETSGPASAEFARALRAAQAAHALSNTAVREMRSLTPSSERPEAAAGPAPVSPPLGRTREVDC